MPPNPNTAMPISNFVLKNNQVYFQVNMQWYQIPMMPMISPIDPYTGLAKPVAPLPTPPKTKSKNALLNDGMRALASL